MRRSRFTFALVIALGLSMIAAMSGAASVGDPTGQNTPRFARIDPSLYESNGPMSAFVPASLSDQPVDVVLELAGDPVAVQEAQAKNAGHELSDADKQAIRDGLAGQQAKLHGSLAAVGATVIGEMQDAYNGIHVTVAQKDIPQLENLPGVVAVHGVTSFTPDNTNAIPFINATTEWGASGFTGKDVKLAVIDTGIDYTHADFGGPGTVAAWNIAKAHSTTAFDPSLFGGQVLFGPGAPKVKGGYDFVGDAYNANIRGSLPQPDPNPLDCNGHGSHTAGSAAGFGVLSNGSTFTGTYNASTITSNTWNVGPGVAPQADLYIYRVFGCAGSSNVVDLAINRAVRDQVDVISMSLGSPLGGTTDATSMAAQNAFRAGITVVASAGNNGGLAYVVGSPSTANGVLSVAAIDGSVAAFPGASLTLSKTGASVKTIDANGAPIAAGTFPVTVLKNNVGGIALGCNKSDYAGTAGMVVVTMRGNCARVARAVFGDEAGDAAVVMVNNGPGLPPFEGTITQNPDTGEQHPVTIPFLGALQSDGAALLAADGGMVTLSSLVGGVPNTNYKKVAGFSSGGPRNPDNASKPDVIAPGVSVSSVGMGTGNQPTVMSGTSMACPMTSGTAALVKQAHPTWTGPQIKAAIMNTATVDASKITGYNVRLDGAGVIQAQKAVNSSVIASTGDFLDSISFGAVAGGSDYTATKSFSITNYGTAPATYNLSVSTNSTRGETIAVSPASVTVAAGNIAGVSVTLTIPSAVFAGLPSDDTFSTGPGGVLTLRGAIVATPATGHPADQQTLRVPYIVVPRGLSEVTPGPMGAFANTAAPGTPGHTIAAALPLHNNGIHSGTADLFTWGLHKASDRGGSAFDIRDAGVQVLPGPTASDRELVFLVNTYGTATNQVVTQFNVDISVNGSGTVDFVVIGFDLGAVLTGSFNGQYGAFTFNAHTGKIVDGFFFADAPMNGSTVELPTLASDLGLSPKANGIGDVKKEGITYRVTSFAVKGGGSDATGFTTINPYSPSVSSGGRLSLAPGASGSVQLTVDTDQQFAQPALGWLVASVDNAGGGAQASEVAAP